MPTPCLTTEQSAAYRRYQGDPDPRQLAHFFHFDDLDLQLIRRHHGRHQRLGFALQLGTVRFLGAFLPNPLDVPLVVIQYVAHQLQIYDLASLPRYLDRDRTKAIHAQEIRDHYGYHDFTDAIWRFRLTRWLYQRAWLSNERTSILFDHAVAWLMQSKVLLPGASTLERLIVSIHERVARRLWRKLANALTPEQQTDLLTMLTVPTGKRQSHFEQVRKSPRDASARGLLFALRRLQTIRALGLPAGKLPSVPVDG